MAGIASPIGIEHDGPLTILTINRPPLNLFDRELMSALNQTVQQIAADPPRGLLIRAEGRAVSGGVDVNVSTASRQSAPPRCGTSCSGSCTSSNSCRCPPYSLLTRCV